MTNFEKFKADILGMTAEEFHETYNMLCCGLIPAEHSYCCSDGNSFECSKCIDNWFNSEVE